MRKYFVFTTLLFYIIINAQVSPKEIPAPDELQIRYDMTKNRIFKGTVPEYNEELILNDLVPDPARQEKRLYSHFSGDLSGRYFSAIARMPINERPENFTALMQRALSMQQPDGRFGNPALVFTPEAITKKHMALLWGNGRLLVGLLDYYNAYQSSEVLLSAINLANFLTGVANSFINPDVIKKLDGMSVHGFICLTQINEGLVMLAQATGQKSYAEMTRRLYMALQPRGGQHAHGYLTTMRGVMKLYEFNKDITVLAYAKGQYDSLINSPDYKITGGILEYFGNKPPYEQHDEGCTEVDFLQLSFQMWKATKNIGYLEKAENCILNHFFFNQFENGDFGHHVVDGNAGYRMNNEDMKAWWCCTLHGILGMQDIRKNIVTADSNSHKINLYFNTKYADKKISMEIKKIKYDMPQYMVSFQLPASEEVALGFRKPSWASTFIIMLNNAPIPFEDLNGYCVVRKKWNVTDKLKIIMSYKMNYVTSTGKEISSVQIGTEPVEAYMKYGPYLMAADGAASGKFLDSHSGKNIIYINDFKKSPEKAGNSSIPDTYLTFRYKHDGFEGIHDVTLRPISEIAFKPRTYFRALLRFSN